MKQYNAAILASALSNQTYNPYKFLTGYIQWNVLPNHFRLIKSSRAIKPCHQTKTERRFKDDLCPHHQGACPETSASFSLVTRPIAREDFINSCRRESFKSYDISD
jgi:hypothetical protein